MNLELRHLGANNKTIVLLQTMKLPVLHIWCYFLLWTIPKEDKRKETGSSQNCTQHRWSHSHVLVLVPTMSTILHRKPPPKRFQNATQKCFFPRYLLEHEEHDSINENIAILTTHECIFPWEMWNCCKQALISCATPRTITTVSSVSPSLCNLLYIWQVESYVTTMFPNCMYPNTKEQYILFYLLITLLKLNSLIPEAECIFTNMKLYVEEQNSKLLINKQNKLPKLQISQCN